MPTPTKKTRMTRVIDPATTDLDPALAASLTRPAQPSPPADEPTRWLREDDAIALIGVNRLTLRALARGGMLVHRRHPEFAWWEYPESDLTSLDVQDRIKAYAAAGYLVNFGEG